MHDQLCFGDELNGSRQNYTLTFPVGELPPVSAFWSLTMYDGKTQLLIKNPINRYLINSLMLPSMKKKRLILRSGRVLLDVEPKLPA